MAKSSVPPSIDLIRIITQSLSKISDCLDPQSSTYRLLSQTLPQFGESFSPQNPVIITYYQLLLLLGLTFYGGISIPSLKKISQTEDTLSFQWAGGIRDTFKLGVWDERFLKFFKTMTKKILKDKMDSPSYVFLDRMIQLLFTYSATLTNIQSIIEYLVQNPKNLNSVRASIPALFTLISCLPADQLNALLIHISQFLPSDLEIKGLSGNQLNVTHLFNSPTHDSFHLIEKTQLYLRLFEEDLPIIKSITETHTFSFLESIFENPILFLRIEENLKSLLQNQVYVRLKLYYIFSSHLDALLKSSGRVSCAI